MLPEESYGTGNARPAPMTLAELRTILRYNPETGGFTWLIDVGRARSGKIAGTVTGNGYIVIKINGQFFKAHRLAWFFATEIWPDPALEIDHINRVKGDNRILNLRLVTKSINQKNVDQRRTWKPKIQPDGPRRIGRGFERPAPMTADDMRATFNYDRLTGLLTWAIDCGGKDAKRIKAGTLAGCRNCHGYIVIRLGKVLYPAHRLAWFIETGVWAPNMIDHINGIKDDNRIANLRLATASQNGANRRASLPNTSGYRGVTRHGGKWIAQIGINGHHTSLGTFDTPEAAHDAYRAAVLAHHGEFGRVT